MINSPPFLSHFWLLNSFEKSSYALEYSSITNPFLHVFSWKEECENPRKIAFETVLD
jgi:hypothetical protein